MGPLILKNKRIMACIIGTSISVLTISYLYWGDITNTLEAFIIWVPAILLGSWFSYLISNNLNLSPTKSFLFSPIFSIVTFAVLFFGFFFLFFTFWGGF